MKKTLILIFLFFVSVSLIEAKKMPSIQLVTDLSCFSPNDDKIKDEIVFKIETKKVKSPKMWELQISDKNGTALKTFSGEDKLPSSLSWNGTDESGKVCSEGIYTASIKVLNNDDLILTHSISFNLDITPPTVALTSSQQTVSTQKELNSFVTYNLSAVDLSEIAGWQLKIYDSSNRDFSSETSTMPLPGSWTLQSDSSKIPTEKLMATLHVTDSAGNAGVSAPVTIEIEHETEKIEKKSEKERPYLQITLIMSIADLFENIDPPTLSPSASSLLVPISKMISVSPGCRITILGHVDEQSTPQEAKSLSSAFAWKIFSFFVKEKGINKELISVKGLGADVPIADNRTSIGRMRNRRIEIQIYFPKPK